MEGRGWRKIGSTWLLWRKMFEMVFWVRLGNCIAAGMQGPPMMCV